MPIKRVAKILNYAMERIKSVPYRPSGRWVYYQIYQKFGLSKKNGAKLFDKWTSRARKNFWNGWHPEIFSDSVRKAHVRGGGSEDPVTALDSMRKHYFVFDKIAAQEYYVEIWFEAAAMHEQFSHETSAWCVTLVPFRGDASIPFKYEIAKRLEKIYEQHGKPIVILYFGDYDKKGLQIPESACEDIRKWCDADFEFIRCGINEDQIEGLDIPENPDKPGTYQWEALAEDQAREMIIGNLQKYWDYDAVQEITEREEELEDLWEETVGPTINEMIKAVKEAADA